MNRVAKKVTLLLTLAAVVLSGCLRVDNFVVYCDRAELVYRLVDENGDPYVGDSTVSVQVVRASDNVAISAEYTLSEDGSITIPFYEKQDEDTTLYLLIDGEGDQAEGAINCSTSGTRMTTWFEPGDARINRQAYAYASVYCQDDNQRVAIYGIHSAGVGDPDRNDGSGFPAIFVPYADLPPVPTESNVLIAEYRDIEFYRLTTGEYQINAGPDPEGKEYVLIWDNCPSSYIQAYVLQNGVLTQTEVYPRSE